MIIRKVSSIFLVYNKSDKKTDYDLNYGNDSHRYKLDNRNDSNDAPTVFKDIKKIQHLYLSMTRRTVKQLCTDNIVCSKISSLKVLLSVY